MLPLGIDQCGVLPASNFLHMGCNKNDNAICIFCPFPLCGNKCVIYLHNYRSQATCRQSQNFARQPTCVFHTGLGKLSGPIIWTAVSFHHSGEYDLQQKRLSKHPMRNERWSCSSRKWIVFGRDSLHILHKYFSYSNFPFHLLFSVSVSKEFYYLNVVLPCLPETVAITIRNLT